MYFQVSLYIRSSIVIFSSVATLYCRMIKEHPSTRYCEFEFNKIPTAMIIKNIK